MTVPRVIDESDWDVLPNRFAAVAAFPTTALGDALCEGLTQRMVLRSIRRAAERSADSPLRSFILSVTDDEELADVS